MRLRLGILMAMTATPAFAHAGETHGWSLEPYLIVPLLLSAMLFAVGWNRLHPRAVRGATGLRRQGLLFAMGWLVLAGALVSPLHSAGRHSFTAHMLEHELLMLLAAPLLVMSRPLPIFLWAFPSPLRQTVGRMGLGLAPTFRALTGPLMATALQAAALWAWHAPSLFDAALRNEGWHIAQHASFLGSSLLFWSAMLHPKSGQRSALLAPFCLFVTSLVGGGLGALMALAPSPWYAGYAAPGLTTLGLTPTEDQQLAGLLMWVPGGAVHAAAALALLGAALKNPGKEVLGAADR